jgi:hypothetical protein
VQFQDLAAFLAQDREQAEKARQAALEEHTERMALQQQIRQEQKAEAEARRIAPCDGSDPRKVRAWMREVEMSMGFTDQTIYVAAHSATGDLRVEIELFMEGNRNRATWDALKNHLSDAFLLPQEEEKLRHEITRMKQGPYETCQAYGRRFRALADLAYPPTMSNIGPVRNTDQNRILRDAYVQGLKDSTIRQRLCWEARPDTYQQAMFRVSTYSNDDFVFKRLDNPTQFNRNEEPMEIGLLNQGYQQPIYPHQPHQPPQPSQQSYQPAYQPQPSQVNQVAQPPQDQTHESSMAKDIRELKRQMSGLAAQFTKQMSMNSQPRQPSNSQPQQQQRVYQFTQDGRPVCAYCGKAGHLARECMKRKAQRQMANQRNPSNQQGNY